MAYTIQKITADVVKPNLFCICAKQNDTNSRFLEVTITENGNKLPLNNVTSVVFNAKRKDNKSQGFFGTVNADTVTVELNSWMLELYGVCECDITIIDSEDRELTTTKFLVKVEERAYSGDEIIEADDYSVLMDLINRVKEIENNGGSGGTGTTDYEKLENKPTINGVELIGDVEINIPEKTSELTNDSDFTTKNYVDDLVSKLTVNFAPLTIDSYLDVGTLTTGAYQTTNSGDIIVGEQVCPVEAGSLIYFVSLGGYGDYNCAIVSHFDVISIQYVEKEYKISCLSVLHDLMAFLTEFTEITLPETYATKEYVDEKFNSIVNGNEVAY